MVSETFRPVAFSRRARSGSASRSILDGSVVGIMLTLRGPSAARPGAARRRQQASTARGETVIWWLPTGVLGVCAADCTGHAPPAPPLLAGSFQGRALRRVTPTRFPLEPTSGRHAKGALQGRSIRGGRRAETRRRDGAARGAGRRERAGAGLVRHVGTDTGD